MGRTMTWVAIVLCLAAGPVPATAARAAGPAGAGFEGQGYQGGGARADRAIEAAFRTALRRAPDDRELRRYRIRIHEDHWTERDIVDDLLARPDYRSHGERRASGGGYDPDRVIERGYDDVLGRPPDAEGQRTYRRRMVDDGWTERQVREALRESPEHAAMSSASADRVIRRAYQDLLGRQPDANGLASYRNQMIEHGFDEHDVRQAIMNSPEYRQKSAGISEAQARDVVRRAYLSVLEREPDAAGSQGYVQRVLRDHWTEREVARELRNSDEFRKKQ